ncbi:type II toxin-antitoxin system RelE/ParE family toxin [Rhizobium calliandrae]|uniref:Type II toxin-antitoxin system RelE/ParE family toxin n=1 Tax=Rhizobium calliandrae TaxID=1312182 RepID=A0ABT7KII6_9HYPH|nr:type II toxin-antitoxin system RelE/ParE family toxin [Rhizobium calliandrae]MDL2408444.1 type II toxin-antitoxin system RelE/ParE family toxin [Rhizobium calliandrae]
MPCCATPPRRSKLDWSTPDWAAFKKRVAGPGRGKRGSDRTVVGHRHADRLIFVNGFATNETENVRKKEKEALRKLCDV